MESKRVFFVAHLSYRIYHHGPWFSGPGRFGKSSRHKVKDKILQVRHAHWHRKWCLFMMIKWRLPEPLGFKKKCWRTEVFILYTAGLGDLRSLFDLLSCRSLHHLIKQVVCFVYDIMDAIYQVDK